MSAPSPRSFLVTETIDLLLYISKTQSFTETSRLMGLSQSMVSRKLSAFEAATGITAVDRSSRPVKLTPQEQKVLFSGNFIGAYGALENVSKASEQAAGLILHNCPYSFRSYMLANYGPGLGQAMSALLASDYQDPYVLVSEIKDVPIVVTYQNTGRLPISEFNKFRKTELPNLSYIEFPAKAPAQTVNKEAEELRERIIKFFDTRTTS